MALKLNPEIFIIYLLVIYTPLQVASKSWLVEGGKQICHKNIHVCTCNRKINGITVLSSSSSATNETTECQTYHLLDSEDCTLNRDKRDAEQVRIATNVLENLPQNLEAGFGYPLGVHKQYNGGEKLYAVMDQNQANEYVQPSNVKDLSIDLCPKEHTIFNNTLSMFNRLQKLKIEGKDATVKVNSSGFLSEMKVLASLRIINVKLENVSLGEFCQSQSLDEVVLTFTHPSIIQGFNCLNRNCGGPCLKALLTADLTGNNISDVNFQFTSVFPYIEELFLMQNQLTTVNANVFSGLTRLQTLQLSQNRIESIRHLAFSNMPNLKVLNLSRNSLTALDFRLFESLSELAVLFLCYNKLQVVDGTYFPDSIEEVHLQSNNISMLTGQAFLSRSRRKFRMLNLTENNLREFTEKSIKSSTDEFRDTTKLQLLIDGNR